MRNTGKIKKAISIGDKIRAYKHLAAFGDTLDFLHHVVEDEIRFYNYREVRLDKDIHVSVHILMGHHEPKRVYVNLQLTNDMSLETSNHHIQGSGWDIMRSVGEKLTQGLNQLGVEKKSLHLLAEKLTEFSAVDIESLRDKYDI